MSEISAKLCSMSFSKQNFQTGISKENWNLIKWIVSCAAIMTVCVPYVYIVPHIAVNPSTNHSLNHTIYDTFEVRTLQVVWATGCCIKECSSIRVPWIKLSFCESTQFVSFEYIVFWPKILFLVLGPLHLCWFLTVGPFNT